jgi:hypothetical protein
MKNDSLVQLHNVLMNLSVLKLRFPEVLNIIQKKKIKRKRKYLIIYLYEGPLIFLVGLLRIML